ncbi:MAG TPA: hypothetical protein VGE97_07775 [Nitrososphaera sp.]|jgi:hypothetical protein
MKSSLVLTTAISLIGLLILGMTTTTTIAFATPFLSALPDSDPRQQQNNSQDQFIEGLGQAREQMEEERAADIAEEEERQQELQADASTDEDRAPITITTANGTTLTVQAIDDIELDGFNEAFNDTSLDYGIKLENVSISEDGHLTIQARLDFYADPENRARYYVANGTVFEIVAKPPTGAASTTAPETTTTTS